jgi:hypothetical protein
VTSDPLTKPLPLPSKEAPPPRIVRALKAFEEAAGGRDRLVAELAPAALSDQESMVLRLLADPDNDRKPLHEILGYAGVSVARFLRIFRDARGARAYLDALDKVWSRLPDVAADVMERALPKTVFCKPCAGTGFQQVHVGNRPKSGPLKGQDPPVVCPKCDGVGRRPVEPTLDYQRLALALGGLPKSVPAVHIDQSRTQKTTLVGSDTMRDFISAVSRIRHTPIDVEATIKDGPVEQEDEDERRVEGAPGGPEEPG